MAGRMGGRKKSLHRTAKQLEREAEKEAERIELERQHNAWCQFVFHNLPAPPGLGHLTGPCCYSQESGK